MPDKADGNEGTPNGTSRAVSPTGVKEKTQDEEKTGEGDTQYHSLLPFCIVSGIASLFAATMSTYLSSQITTMEKVFDMSSQRAGVLMSANDIGFLSTVLFASHFLHRFHIPRILAGSVMLFGASAAFCSLPNFIEPVTLQEGHHHKGQTNTAASDMYLCLPRDGNDTSIGGSCGSSPPQPKADNSSSHQWVFSLLFVLFLIQGIAKSPRTALATTYIDNNSPKTKTGFYLGIAQSLTIFGPFLAITAGGMFNKLPINLKETALTPEDPRWIGAWWMGFIVFGGAAVLTSIPVVFFRRGRKSAQEGSEGVQQKDPPFLQQVKDMPKAVLRVLTRPVYTLTVTSTIAQMFAIMSMAAFGPKYMENQFNIPTWKANTILGGEKLVTTVLGTFLGGLVTRRFRLDVKGCLKLVIVTRLLSAAFTGLLYVFGCDGQNIHGMGTQTSAVFAPGLNTTCDCTGTPFLPVCVDGTSTYYSPCHAGCQIETGSGGYSNCTGASTGDVTMGLCHTGCSYLIPYVAASGLGSLIGTMSLPPLYVVMLRVVKDSDRTLAVGMNSFLVSLLVLFPAPILFGHMYDSFCTIWRHKCGGHGACSLYDIRAMRVTTVSVDFGLRAASTVLAVLALFCANRASRKIETDKKMITIEMK